MGRYEVKIRVTIEVDRTERLGIAEHSLYDWDGKTPASYEDVRDWILSTVYLELYSMRGGEPRDYIPAGTTEEPRC